MEAMTISQVEHARAKVENALAVARFSHGKPGRQGVIVDSTELIARLERRLADWDRLLEFARQN